MDRAPRSQRPSGWDAAASAWQRVWPRRVGSWGLGRPGRHGSGCFWALTPSGPDTGPQHLAGGFQFGARQQGVPLTTAAHVLSETDQRQIHANRPSRGQHPGPLPENLPELQPRRPFSLTAGGRCPRHRSRSASGCGPATASASSSVPGFAERQKRTVPRPRHHRSGCMPLGP